MNADAPVVTIRKRKVKSNFIKVKLIFFSALAAALLLVAVFADVLCPHDPNKQKYSQALSPPSLEHPLGTDRFGRDMLSRVIIGSQASIFSALSLVAIISIAGTLLGLCCGYFGRSLDTIVMRISDICLAFPGLVFALAIAAMLNGGLHNAVLALAAIGWPKYARIARSRTLALRSADFISASRLSGSTPFKIMTKHVLPNISGPILVTAMLDIGTMMMEIAALSFLGLGAKPPTAEWGSMMSVGRSMLQTYPWVVLSPGLAIFVSVVIFNLLGDTVRDYCDPRNSRTK